jgi:hypothetical protein
MATTNKRETITAAAIGPLAGVLFSLFRLPVVATGVGGLESGVEVTVSKVKSDDKLPLSEPEESLPALPTPAFETAP